MWCKATRSKTSTAKWSNSSGVNPGQLFGCHRKNLSDNRTPFIGRSLREWGRVRYHATNIIDKILKVVFLRNHLSAALRWSKCSRGSEGGLVLEDIWGSLTRKHKKYLNKINICSVINQIKQESYSWFWETIAAPRFGFGHESSPTFTIRSELLGED